MSTPVIERPGTPGGGRPRPQIRRTAAPPRIPAQRGPGDTRRVQDQRRRTARENTGRAKFVLVVMVLLAVGLIATLWLSTAAAADSHALLEARQRTGALTEQAESLRKEVTVLQSPASLAQRATAQGMVPVADPARLVVAPDGRVTVVGEPQAAVGRAAPAAPGAVAPPVPPQSSGTSDPEATGGDAAAAAGAESGAAGGAAGAAPEDSGQDGAGQVDDGQAGTQEGAEREVPADARAAGRG